MSVKLGTLTLDLVARVSGFTQGMNQASTSAEREMRRVENSIVSVDGLIKKLAVTAGATFSVAQITNYADGYTGMVNKLKLVTEGQGQLSTAMTDTYKIAQATASDWGSVVDVYTKFQKISEKVGLSQTDVARITETVTKAVGMSGASSDEAQRSLVQFSQALSLGTLKGQDLNSVMSQTPGLTDAIAKGLGIGSDKLKQMGTDGELSTQKIIGALQKVAQTTDEEFAKTATAISASFNLVEGAATKMIGEFDAANGVSKTFVEGMTLLSENMDVVTNTMMVGAAFMAGKYIPTVYASALSLSEKAASQLASMRAEQLANEITAQRTARVAHLTAVELANAEAQLARMSGMARLAYLEATVIPLRKANTTALAADTVAQNANNQSKNLGVAASGRLATALMGPVGLGLAVAGVAASYLMLKDSTKDTTSTLDLQKGTVAELVAEYSKLDDLQQRTTMRELEKQVRDLSTAYTVAFSDLNAFIGWLDDSGSVSESTAKEVNRLYKEYRAGGLSASDFATAINGLSGVQVKHKQKIDDLTTAQAKSKTEYEKVKTAQDALTKQTGAAVKANKDEAESIDAKRIAQEKLNQKQEAALNAIKGDIAREAYINANMKAGFSRDKSEFYADYRSKAELGYTGKSISSEESATVAAGYKLKQQTEARLASEKAIEASQKKQTKEAEKKYEYAQAEVKLLSKAYGDVSQSGLGAYAESRGIPANVIAGLYMQESKAGTDLTSHTGAKGPWQTTAPYREQNNISIADNNDFLKVGKIVVDNIAKVFADTGSLKQAILSHNAGETGAKNFMKDGRVKGSDSRNKEVAGFLPSIDKWASWGSGNKGELLGESDSGKDYQDFLDAQLKKQEAVKQLQAQFDTEAIQRSKERDEQINQATILGQMDLIPKIKERYNQQELLASYQLEMELNGYKWGEDQKIAYQRDISKLELEISGKYGAEETKLRKNGIDALAQYEIDEYRKTQKLKIAEYQLAFSQPLTDLQAEVLDMQAKANMGGGYGAWALQNQYGKDLNSFGDDYDKNVNNINEDKTITDDATRKQLLLDAEESFRLSKLALNEKYTLLEKDLAQSQQETQLSAWGNLLGQAQNTWGQITQSIKDANGEQSASFKTAFLAQQMFALGSAYVSTHLAAIQAMAAPDMIMFGQKIVASEAILAMGYANMALIGAQTIAGFATGGHITGKGTGTSDEIPIWASNGEYMLKTSAVNKIGKANLDYMNLTGELPHQYKFADGGLIGDVKVLDPQQNKDLTNYLSGKPSNSQPIVNVHTLPGTTATATTNADGSLDLRIQQLAQQEVRGAFARMSQNQNSYEAKQTKRAFNVRANRK